MAAVVERVFYPRDVVELGSVYLDRRRIVANSILNSAWDRCVKTYLACNYGGRRGFGTYDLSICIIPEAPYKLGKRESRLLTVNVCAVARTVLFCGDNQWNWGRMIGDSGFEPDEKTTRRFIRRVYRTFRDFPFPDIVVYRRKEWVE